MRFVSSPCRAAARADAAVGDVTHDHVVDLVVATPRTNACSSSRAAATRSNFRARSDRAAVPGGPSACSIGDVTGDGQTDLVMLARSRPTAVDP